MPIIYPYHQGTKPLIEKLFLNYFQKKKHTIESNLTYIPIQWSAYHIRNNYGINNDELNKFLYKVSNDFSKENFFTIVQYDGGVLVQINNCKIFASSGNFASPEGINTFYEPIPLFSSPHKVFRRRKRNTLASFAGRLTHEVRNLMYDELKTNKLYKFYIQDKNTINKQDSRIFRDLLLESYFGFCPRGYGPTSFRLYETIQLGCIPVIISDEFWLPFQEQIDWKKLAILVKPNEIHQIPELIYDKFRSNEYKKMQEYGKHCYRKYFSWTGIRNQVLRKIYEY
jgi:hypothetical protein